jgi:hypothetical protein
MGRNSELIRQWTLLRQLAATPEFLRSRGAMSGSTVRLTKETLRVDVPHGRCSTELCRPPHCRMTRIEPRLSFQQRHDHVRPESRARCETHGFNPADQGRTTGRCSLPFARSKRCLPASKDSAERAGFRTGRGESLRPASSVVAAVGLYLFATRDPEALQRVAFGIKQVEHPFCPIAQPKR